jgi:hypothetical protein
MEGRAEEVREELRQKVARLVAEAIIQVRAAALSDDDRLVQHLRTRPGSPFTRQPKLRQLPVK